MMGKLQVLAAGVMLALATMVAGCVVAESGDEEPLDDGAAALVGEGDSQDPVTVRDEAGEEVTNPLNSVKHGEGDPDPLPWTPTAAAQGLPGNPNDPGPSPKGR